MKREYATGDTITIEPYADEAPKGCTVRYMYILPDGNMMEADVSNPSFVCEMQGTYVIRYYIHNDDRSIVKTVDRKVSVKNRCKGAENENR